jgi:peptide/nickel transport system ATP-binding protein
MSFGQCQQYKGLIVKQGAIVEIANSDEIYRHPKHSYTQKLLSAIPKGWHHGN